MTPLELKNTRKAIGLTQARLAELIGVTDSTVARWEMGVHPISFPIEQLLKAQAASAGPTTACGWTDLDLSRVAAHARQAFEQLRLKKCLVLTKILLQADPQNEEARALESSIRSALQEDLQNVRALLEAQLKDNPQVAGRRAEIILWRVLHIDPKNEEAKALLSIVKTLSPALPSHVAAEPAGAAPEPPVPSELPESASPPPASSLRPAEAAGSKPSLLPGFSIAVKRRQRLAIPLTIAVFLAVLAVLVLTMPRKIPKEQQDIASASANSTELSNNNSDGNKDPVQSSSNDPDSGATLASFSPVSRPLPERHTAGTAKLTPVGIEVPSGPSASSTVRQEIEPPRRPAAGETGRLAVNSLLAAEIYMGGKYVGSTPITLELPAGTHTLEYRHQDLRKVLTHVVRASETTAARITFEVTVQINAKPWASVFLEGTERQALGQTPLSGVIVPAGSTLVFENPNFPRKAYRVTGTETAIQVVFP